MPVNVGTIDQYVRIVLGLALVAFALKNGLSIQGWPDPTADDDHIRSRIIDVLEKNDWCPFGLNAVVRDGIVHLTGVVTEERSRQAAIVDAENVAGVKKVHDHLCWVEPMSGMYLESPEDTEMAKAS